MHAYVELLPGGDGGRTLAHCGDETFLVQRGGSLLIAGGNLQNVWPFLPRVRRWRNVNAWLAIYNSLSAGEFIQPLDNTFVVLPKCKWSSMVEALIAAEAQG